MFDRFKADSEVYFISDSARAAAAMSASPSGKLDSPGEEHGWSGGGESPFSVASGVVGGLVGVKLLS